MPRHPRVHSKEVVYHLIARGNNRQKTFLEEEDYRSFLASLAKTKRKYPFKLYGYALMPNHLHLLLEIEDHFTSRIMQSLLTGYARYFIRKYRHIGHVFQGRYKGIVCDKDEYLLELLRYIHLNPVRADLVKNPADWPWSGHLEYTGKEKRDLIDRGLISGMLGEGEKGYQRYKTLLEDGLGKSYEEDFHPQESQPFLGGEAFIDKMVNLNLDKKIAENKLEIRKRLSLDELLKETAQANEIAEGSIRQKTRVKKVFLARKKFVEQAAYEYGYSQTEIARYLGCEHSNISKMLRGK